MGVYQITYAPQISEVCLHFDGGCNFHCHGCVSKQHPDDIHLDHRSSVETKKQTLSHEQVISLLEPFRPQKIIFMGREPTVDPKFIFLARVLKEEFSTYNILLTNGWKYADSKAIDEVCVSIKAISQTLFRDFTGKNEPDRVLANFKKYASNPMVKVRAESVLIPNYIDYGEIAKIARFIANVDDTIPYRIDAYIPIPAFRGGDKFRNPTQEEIKVAKEIAQKYLRYVSILPSGLKVKYQVERLY